MHDATSTSPNDDVGWEQIYRENEVRLRALIARRVPSDVVDDVLQDTFLRAYRSRHTLDRARPVGPWLTTIALRAASDHRRNPMRHVLPDVPAAASDAYEDFRVTARLRVIESAFRSLRPRQRRLLASVAIDGVSQVNIARGEGATSEAVRAGVLRARRRFRAEYERLVRDSGLASLSGIKPAIGRLRARLHRVGTMVPVHADACLGLATLTAVTFLTLGASNGTAVAAVPPRIVVSGLSPVASLERSGLDLGRPIKPWLTAIAVRASIDEGTHQHERISPVPQPEASPAAEDEMLARQRGAVIAAAFGALTDRHRRLLASIAFEEATPRGLAAQENVAPEALRAVLSRARQSFRLAYQRFAEQAGLATLGGSLRPAFTRARLRTLPIERIRPLEAFAVLLFATTATTSASSGTHGGGVVEAPPTVGISLASISTGASEMMSSAAVARLSERSDVSVRAPGADVVGSVDRREGTLNTFWALRLEPLGAELTLGTDGSTGRLGVEVEITQDGQSSELFAGANVEDCSAGSVTVSTACDAYERGEALGRSTE